MKMIFNIEPFEISNIQPILKIEKQQPCITFHHYYFSNKWTDS